MAAPSTPLLPLRALVFLCITAGAGILAGLLTSVAGQDPPAAVLTGCFAGASTLMWLVNIDWPKIVSVRGAVLVVVATLLGVGAGTLTYMSLHILAAAILASATVFGGALLGLEKIVY